MEIHMDQRQIQRDPRPAAALNSQLDRKLAAYMAAAAGVSLLASPLAEAKVVYTATNTNIAENSQVFLDLNHDGVNDFSFSHFAYGNWDHFYGAGLATNHIFGNGSASALRLGVPIGPKGHFSHFGLMAKIGVISGSNLSTGKWLNVQNRYLGLQFSINGTTHYGWARFTVTLTGGIVGTLTGYAYETIPNKRILAGQTSGAEVTSAFGLENNLTPQNRTPTLGLLARGADALSIWRREDELGAR
jgi:hypothetical protein